MLRPTLQKSVANGKRYGWFCKSIEVHNFTFFLGKRIAIMLKMHFPNNHLDFLQ